VSFNITDAAGAVITVPVDGQVYSAAFRTTPPTGALFFTMGGVDYPVKRNVAGALVDLSGQLSNNYPRCFYFDQTNGCFVLLYGSGKEDEYSRVVKFFHDMTEIDAFIIVFIIHLFDNLLADAFLDNNALAFLVIEKALLIMFDVVVV
jgi:hypothetical protein